MLNLKDFNRIVGSAAEEFADSGLDDSLYFPWAIKKQNTMYELPVNTEPTLDGLGESPIKRMQGFMKTLQKEMDEGKDILMLLQLREDIKNGATSEGIFNFTDTTLTDKLRDIGFGDRALSVAEDIMAKMDAMDEELSYAEAFDRYILVALADWHGDMHVYNRSEAMKYGIPLEPVLACIMGSNFTKLGANGEVLKDENGKFLKGPNFAPPEAAIYTLMFESEALIEEYTEQATALEKIAAVSLPALMNPVADMFEAPDDYEDPELDPDLEDEDE